MARKQSSIPQDKRVRSIYIDKVLDARLIARAEQEERTCSALIRYVLKSYLAQPVQVIT